MPESTQSIILASFLTVPYGQVFQPVLNAMNNILGGDFVSRFNMNLREDKHWSYGAGSFIWDAKAQRPFLAYVSVQMDKTKESILEIKKEFTSIISDKPITMDEFNRVQQNMTLQLPGALASGSFFIHPPDGMKKLPRRGALPSTFHFISIIFLVSMKLPD